jgi:hypothetical protein
MGRVGTAVGLLVAAAVGRAVAVGAGAGGAVEVETISDGGWALAGGAVDVCAMLQAETRTANAATVDEIRPGFILILLRVFRKFKSEKTRIHP